MKPWRSSKSRSDSICDPKLKQLSCKRIDIMNSTAFETRKRSVHKNMETAAHSHVKTQACITDMFQLKPHNKTKKVKREYSEAAKSKMWEMFDRETKTSEVCDTQEIGICCACKFPLMIMDQGLPTCTNVACGIVYRNAIDFSPEWSFYGDEKHGKDPTRCGTPINPLLVESSYGCKVLTNGKSSFEMRKIKKWTEWQAMPHREKALNDEFQFITTMAHNSGIPKIFIDCAMEIYKDISEQKMYRGLNRDGIRAASIYISCRLNGCPRNAHEIAEIFHLDNASATNGCSIAVNILHNIERGLDPSMQTKLTDIKPISFIERFACKLEFPEERVMLAKFIASKVEKMSVIEDNIPHAVASGILYFVARIYNINVTKKDMKTVCGVSEVTINKCYKKLVENKERVVPMCILNTATGTL